MTRAREQRIQPYSQSLKCESIIWEQSDYNTFLPKAILWESSLTSDSNSNRVTSFHYPKLDSVSIILSMIDFTKDNKDDFIFKIKGKDTIYNVDKVLYYALPYNDSLQNFESIDIGKMNQPTMANSVSIIENTHIVTSTNLVENSDDGISTLKISNIKKSVSTNVDDAKIKWINNIKCFPNPASSVLNISLVENYKTNNENATLLIVDQLGQVRKELRILPNVFKDYKIDISGLEVGVYFILLNQIKNKIQIDKIIIER